MAALLFHAQLGFAHNGYVGVDVFFALSGFLITSILLGEIDRTGRVRFRRFCVRRVLRLIPALAAACLAVPHRPAPSDSAQLDEKRASGRAPQGTRVTGMAGTGGRPWGTRHIERTG